MQLVDDLLRQTTAAVLHRQHFPESTYRLQFHAGFTFQDARRLVPYLRDLGVTDCYASPYLKARPGSQHGYDITNHNVLNPEIGTEEDYEAFAAALREAGLGQVLDTVPNHMGIVGNENVWWNDVLENGPASPYATFFDIAWYGSPRPELQERILLPTLGDPYGKVLEAGQIQLDYGAGVFAIHYFEHRFPIAPDSYDLILGHRLEELKEALGPTAEALLEYQSILTAVSHLPRRSETDPARVAEHLREKEVIKRRLATLTESAPAVRAFIEQNVAVFNGKPGDRHSFDLLDQLLDRQAYRLSYWRVASDEINYRRFFDVNELAALSMERPEVFRATHDLILRLLREGKVTGLRIDHPDGLYDPKQYLRRLQAHYVLACARDIFESQPHFQGLKWDELEGPLLEQVAQVAADPDDPMWRPLYVVVEKILGANEPFPQDWPTYGTSGYYFLNEANGLFVAAENAEAFTRLYQEWTGDATPLAEIVYQKKFLILQVALSSELHMLAYQLDRLAQKDRRSRDFTLHSLRHALREVIACFPVYRSYITAEGIHETDRKYVHQAINRARGKNPALSASIFEFVRDMLLLKSPDSFTDEDRAEQLRFVGKFQQVTAPVMAKGLEDTTFYVYNRLLSLNEVGGDPGRFGIPVAAMHRYNQERQAHWPHAMSATSTHDTKRSEDVRARLNVLSEVPGEWEEHLERWGSLNRPHKVMVDEETPVPDANEEYLLYQTLVGAWPLELYTAEEYAAFVKRIQAYMVKALHEAKVHTSWINPNPEYDNAIQEFVARILDEGRAGPFLHDFGAFQKRVSHYGLLNSLAQTLLKIAAPGVPDFYQGTELWDFSLVDPDNRRPVDYGHRRRLLAELREALGKAGAQRADLARELIEKKEDGRVKLYVISQALGCLRDNPGLFSAGEYVPLEAIGGAGHVFAFLRRRGGRTALVVLPRLLTELVPQTGDLPLGRQVWWDGLLPIPDLEPGRRFRNLFTGEILTPKDGRLPLAEVFATFPVALCLAQD